MYIKNEIGWSSEISWLCWWMEKYIPLLQMKFDCPSQNITNFETLKFKYLFHCLKCYATCRLYILTNDKWQSDHEN